MKLLVHCSAYNIHTAPYIEVLAYKSSLNTETNSPSVIALPVNRTLSINCATNRKILRGVSLFDRPVAIAPHNFEEVIGF